MALSAMSTLFLKISRDADSTTCLNNMLQSQTTLPEKTFFPILDLNLLSATRVHFLSSYFCYLAEEANTHLATASFQELEKATKPALSLLFSRQSNPSSFSCSSYDL